MAARRLKRLAELVAHDTTASHVPACRLLDGRRTTRPSAELMTGA
eukprot:CAMPEP_0181250524 /NCGR_PEP_ID=MMETSP1096-20121128/46369_1 /TAXON_ID=156174 ORGANISM="Chrysochromulina ericina, Strain CCMP281" /NCGR_SAMPLE_ID=MMETSP1096 /ASSEMBLY_ACC=CAM_ASM_000453 /LENGTH=44 /DNA_ID= /DNA_START= /DNA_END= /DNA_ORIENTATION=